MPHSLIKQNLLNLPRLVKRTLVIFFDFLACGISVWLAFGLILEDWGFLNANEGHVLIATLALAFPLFMYFGLYKSIFRHIGSIAFFSIINVFFIYALAFFSLFSLIGLKGVPRSIGVIQPILLFILVGASRFFMRYWLGGPDISQKKGRQPKPIAFIYGAGAAGRQLASALSINREILIRGFVDDDISLHGNSINGVDIYRASDIKNLIIKFNITDMLLALPSTTQARRNEIIASLDGCGVRVRSVPGLIDMASGRVRISDLHDLDMNELLGRQAVSPNIELLKKNIHNKIVLVTGAGGSIGSELCRQIIKFSPKSLILVDNSEHSLYLIYEELKALPITGDAQDLLSSKKTQINITPFMASILDSERLFTIFAGNKPETVFHAAAYKHVPLVEQNPIDGIRNNVFGTYNCVQAAYKNCCKNFILVSTDKAVRPTNIMGASKRIAELILQALSSTMIDTKDATKFSMVRFGNVLGSSGSVTPLFASQIRNGGPITLTHAEITRFFMTIPEAAQLVIQASSMASGGDVFVLDMGKPVRVYDLARKMIHLSGYIVKDDLNPDGDIEIQITGLRPGEKLYEEVLIGNDPQPTAHPKIMKAHEGFISWNDLKIELETLNRVLCAGDELAIRALLIKLVPEYHPQLC